MSDRREVVTITREDLERATSRRMDGDEHEVLELVRKRLEKGHVDYGDLDVCDGRDWEAEALDEALDGVVYLAAAILEMQKRREAPENFATLTAGAPFCPLMSYGGWCRHPHRAGHRCDRRPNYCPLRQGKSVLVKWKEMSDEQ